MLLEAAPVHAGDVRFGLAVVQQAVLEDPDRVDAKGDAKHKAWLTEMVDKQPEDVTLLLSAAMLMFDLGDNGTAKAYAKRLRPRLGPKLEHLPEDQRAPFFFMLGGLAEVEGNLESAEKFLRQAFEADPSQEASVVALARLLGNTRKFDEARTAVAEGLLQTPYSVKLHQLEKQLAGPIRYPSKRPRSMRYRVTGDTTSE